MILQETPTKKKDLSKKMSNKVHFSKLGDSFISSIMGTDLQREPGSKFLDISWCKRNSTHLIGWVFLSSSVILGISEFTRAIILTLQAKAAQTQIAIPLIYAHLDFHKLAQKAALFLSIMSFIYASFWFMSICSKLVVSKYHDDAMLQLLVFHKELNKEVPEGESKKHEAEIAQQLACYKKKELTLIYLYLADILLIQCSSIGISIFALAEAINAILLSPSMFSWMKDFHAIMPSHPMLIYSIIGLSIGLPSTFFNLICETIFMFQGLARIRQNQLLSPQDIPSTQINTFCIELFANQSVACMVSE